MNAELHYPFAILHTVREGLSNLMTQAFGQPLFLPLLELNSKYVLLHRLKGQFGLKGKRRGVEEKRVKLADNKLIFSQFYSTLFYFTTPPFLLIQVDHKCSLLLM